MPALAWLALAAVGGAVIQDKLDDAFGGAPSPFSLGGIAVWGLAGYGAWCLAKRTGAV